MIEKPKPQAVDSTEKYYSEITDKYGLSIAFADNNSVHVSNRNGVVVPFEWPLMSIAEREYDAFILQMLDASQKLPSITVINPRTIFPPEFSHSHLLLSSGREERDLAAEIYGIDQDEVSAMWSLARKTLYNRFKARLREKKQMDT